MIDPIREHLLTPTEAAQLYPRRSGGRPPHVSTVIRHMTRGSRGVRLESIRTPRLATSREAVARFFTRLTEARPVPEAVGGRPHSSYHHRIEAELDQLGL